MKIVKNQKLNEKLRKEKYKELTALPENMELMNIHS